MNRRLAPQTCHDFNDTACTDHGNAAFRQDIQECGLGLFRAGSLQHRLQVISGSLRRGSQQIAHPALLSECPLQEVGCDPGQTKRIHKRREDRQVPHLGRGWRDVTRGNGLTDKRECLGI